MTKSRTVCMVQRRVTEAGGQLAAIDPNLGHWGVDVVDDAAGITRFEAFQDDGRIFLSVTTPKPGGDYKALSLPAAGKGVTQMSDEEIRAVCNLLIAENPRYSLAVNNCQTFAMLLVDKVVMSNTILGKFNAWQMGLLRNFA